MPRYRISPQATDDIKSIVSWIKRDRPAAAQRVNAKLRATFQFLAANPLAGERRDDLRPGIRVFVPGPPASRYVIFYMESSDSIGVEIATVIDGARDLPNILWSGDE
jgi:plasmid stabilization system protein ParE